MQEQSNRKKWTDTWKAYIPYGAVIAGVMLAGGIYLTGTTFLPRESGFVLEEELSPTESDTKSNLTRTESMTETVETVVVYVCGAVIQPGVYELPKGSRLVAAVEAAGGLSGDAWEERINLAQTVSDGEQIYVPCQEERFSAQNPQSGSGSEIQTQKMINLNTATKEQLMELPGIGEAKAESILQYRKEQGAFSCPEDIMKVSGIKQSLYDKIRELITV